MRDLTHEQFAQFFAAVHGHQPFEWQKRLAKEVLENGWHDVIRVPTACGKTSILDIAIFELASQADLQPMHRTAARRICFVINRRLVVDEVTEHASRIQRALAAASRSCADPTLNVVARRLAGVACDSGTLLRVARLRGGVYLDNGWAADPLTPTILVATIDQIGSRLLFRGYGVGSGTRPTHAGLLAFDTRIILDEAHLSTVFGDTVQRIQQYQTWAVISPLTPERRVSIVRMSATAGEGKHMFELDKEERKDARLKERLEARKPTDLVAIKVEPITKQLRTSPARARAQEKNNRAEMVMKLVSEAKRLAALTVQIAGPPVIAVVVNRVATARQVFESLQQSRSGPEYDAILLTGRIRPYDRDILLAKWLPHMQTERKTQHGRPLFVVATQTVEVGANLDFDALVTEAAPIDSLRQRFGRLDRLGKRWEQTVSSPAVIVIRSDHKSTTHNDEIYGGAIAETWKWLNQKDVRDKAMRVHFGANHLDRKLEKAQNLAAMIAPQSESPLLMPAHLDFWVQTDPIPDPDPDIGPFLHGRANASADVQVVWRADLDEQDQDSWKNIVKLMPPRTREALAVPVYEVQRWLRNEATADVADLEGAAISDERESWHNARRRALRWRGAKNPQTKPVDGDELRPGDTIVVPATYGGNDIYGWNPACLGEVTDVADQCLAQLIASHGDNRFRRPKLRLRLHQRFLPRADNPAQSRLLKLLDSALVAARAEQHDAWPAARAVLQAMISSTEDPERRAAMNALLQAKPLPQIVVAPKYYGIVLVASTAVALSEARLVPSEELETDEPEDDEASVNTDGRVFLADHIKAVEDMSGRFAESLGFESSDRIAASLREAAHWHDEGKRDLRFQSWLHGSEVEALAALADNRPLGKSGRDPQLWKQSATFGYPRGSRHEFVSVRIFEQASRCGLVPNDLDTDLVKFLIGTHHGYGCAFAPFVNDLTPTSVEIVFKEGKRLAASSDHKLYSLESGWPDLFWCMVRRYGWWGIAYLEALLVTADRLVSARKPHKESRVEATTA